MEDKDRNKAIGLRLQALREEHGWTRAELVRKMQDRPGLSKYNAMTVKRTEEGQRSLKLDEALELAVIFDISLDYLTGNTRYERVMAHRDKQLAASNEEFLKKAVAVEKALLEYVKARESVWEHFAIRPVAEKLSATEVIAKTNFDVFSVMSMLTSTWQDYVMEEEKSSYRPDIAEVATPEARVAAVAKYLGVMPSETTIYSRLPRGAEECEELGVFEVVDPERRFEDSAHHPERD